MYPAQANNAYIFPAVGHAAIITRCRTIPTPVFLKAAALLSSLTTPQQLQAGRLFPPMSDIREVELHLTAALAQFMVQQGLGQLPAGFKEGGGGEGLGAWEQLVRQRMFAPGSLQMAGVQLNPGVGGSQQLQQQQSGDLRAAPAGLSKL